MISGGRTSVVHAIEAGGIVAVIRLQDPERLRAVVDALAEGGIRALEVTMTVPRAIDMIGQLAPALPSGFLLGAGTVLDAETARLAILAGAQFVVSPVCRQDVIAACHRYDVAVMPGCFTPTEILSAWEITTNARKIIAGVRHAIEGR
ncbi:MAG: hypothetical protein LC753_20780 [Acidobacteria bacterium]|nr:hypothetical protein [Acidobacteriota bacterium]